MESFVGILLSWVGVGAFGFLIGTHRERRYYVERMTVLSKKAKFYKELAEMRLRRNTHRRGVENGTSD